MTPFTYHRPRTVPDVLTALDGLGDSALLGGGTCLVDLMKQGVMTPERVVDLNAIAELKGMSIDDDGRLTVAAATTLAAVARDPRVRSGWPMLHEAIVDGLTPQLRNAASFAGNVMQRPRCFYFREPGFACNKRHAGSGCAAKVGLHYQHAIVGGDGARRCIATHPSDLCVALTAFEAHVTIVGIQGERRMAIEALHRLPDDDPTTETNLRPGELITAIDVPPQGPRHGAYTKATEGFALASCAVLITIADERIRRASVVLGGVAHKPWRSRPAEAALIGAEATRDAFVAAADAASTETETDEQTAFRLPLLHAAIVDALGRATASRP